VTLRPAAQSLQSRVISPIPLLRNRHPLAPGESPTATSSWTCTTSPRWALTSTAGPRPRRRGPGRTVSRLGPQHPRHREGMADRTVRIVRTGPESRFSIAQQAFRRQSPAINRPQSSTTVRPKAAFSVASGPLRANLDGRTVDSPPFLMTTSRSRFRLNLVHLVRLRSRQLVAPVPFA